MASPTAARPNGRDGEVVTRKIGLSDEKTWHIGDGFVAEYFREGLLAHDEREGVGAIRQGMSGVHLLLLQFDETTLIIQLLDEPDWDIFYWAVEKRDPPAQWKDTELLEK